MHKVQGNSVAEGEIDTKKKGEGGTGFTPMGRDEGRTLQRVGGN